MKNRKFWLLTAQGKLPVNIYGTREQANHLLNTLNEGVIGSQYSFDQTLESQTPEVRQSKDKEQ